MYSQPRYNKFKNMYDSCDKDLEKLEKEYENKIKDQRYFDHRTILISNILLLKNILRRL